MECVTIERSKSLTDVRDGSVEFDFLPGLGSMGGVPCTGSGASCHTSSAHNDFVTKSGLLAWDTVMLGADILTGSIADAPVGSTSRVRTAHNYLTWKTGVHVST